jgi:hypothetical protein
MSYHSRNTQSNPVPHHMKPKAAVTQSQIVILRITWIKVGIFQQCTRFLSDKIKSKGFASGFLKQIRNLGFLTHGHPCNRITHKNPRSSCSQHILKNIHELAPRESFILTFLPLCMCIWHIHKRCDAWGFEVFLPPCSFKANILKDHYIQESICATKSYIENPKPKNRGKKKEGRAEYSFHQNNQSGVMPPWFSSVNLKLTRIECFKNFSAQWRTQDSSCLSKVFLRKLSMQWPKHRSTSELYILRLHTRRRKNTRFSVGKSPKRYMHIAL